MQFKQKPQTLVCYICGRQFGTKSLEIHLKSCKEKFVRQQDKKEKCERINLPEQPLLLKEILRGNLLSLVQYKVKQSRYNEEALQIHKYKILPACRFCGRTFNQQSIKVHEKACPKKSNAFDSMKKDKAFKEEIFKKPRTLVCCVCGRQFGLTSLKIHYSQCLTKFKNEQRNKPREERRQVPTFSEEQIDMLNNKEDWSLQQIQAFNSRASTGFKDKAMIHCANCKRTFMPDPYRRHLKNCELLNGKNAPIDQFGGNKYKAEQPSQLKKPKVLMCHICGRQFGLTSLKIHQKTCQSKFINNQKQKQGNQRKPLPTLHQDIMDKFDFNTVQKWSSDDIEEYNRFARNAYRSESMYECPFCHRKFIEQSFQKHRKYCQKQYQRKAQQQSASLEKSDSKDHSESKKKSEFPKRDSSPVKPNRKTPALFRQKTNKETKDQVIEEAEQKLEQTNKMQQSIKENEFLDQKEEISPLPQCITFKAPSNGPLINSIQNKILQQSKSEQQKSMHQESESLRKSELQEQPVKTLSNKASSQNLEEAPKNQNIEPFKKKQSSSEINEIQNFEIGACEKCGRKFAVDRLEKHQSVCKGTKRQFGTSKNNFRPKNQSIERSEAKNAIDEETGPMGHSKMLVPCKKCGRRFLQNRVAKHEECCKGKMKKVDIKENNEQKPLLENDRVKIGNPRSNEIQKSPASKNRFVEKAPLETVLAGQNQYQQILPEELRPCEKCGRKFKQDRIEKHENVCKGPVVKKQNFYKQIQQAQKSRNIQIIKKTKDNFFSMVKEIKQQKKSDEQIDQQISAQLQVLQKQFQPQSAKAVSKRRFNRASLEKNEFMRNQGKKINHMAKLQSLDNGLQSVGKWKKSTDWNTPMKRGLKQVKINRDLPEL